MGIIHEKLNSSMSEFKKSSNIPVDQFIHKRASGIEKAFFVQLDFKSLSSQVSNFKKNKVKR